MSTPVHYRTKFGDPAPVIACGAAPLRVSHYSEQPGKVTCFACRRTEVFKNAQLEGVGAPTPIKLSGVMAEAPLFQSLRDKLTAGGARRYRITVEVMCSTLEEAEQVAAERLGPDEDYGFDYQFFPHTVTEVP